MHISLSTILLSLGVSTDTFAASISKGLKQSVPSTFNSIWIALIFSLMELLFLLLGHIAGNAASPFMYQIDHWIAFSVLFILGAKMIMIHPNQSPSNPLKQPHIKSHEILLTAIGTSIDSIALGISTAFMNIDFPIFMVITGIFTFSLSFLGSRFIAQVLSHQLGRFAEKLGGSILIGIGLTILFTHLNLN